ncbi:MAG TPA: porin [Polyangia bacterium]|nr:porin [Polyangia bacterium]
MPQSCPRRPRRLFAWLPTLLTLPLTALVVAVPIAARAQNSTLPPTDISNQQPPTSAAPPAAEAPPAVPAEVPPPAAPMVMPAPAMVGPTPVVAAPAPAASNEVLAGFSDGVPFLRSPDNGFILFPSGRLQTDLYMFDRNEGSKSPNNTFLLRRARLELTGWIGGLAYFSIAGDFAQSPPAGAAPAAPSNIAATDDYIAVAPWNNLAILQVGQYDAPFTLENRTSDKYFDFMERSNTVRSFGIPDNKEIGAMIHGFNDDRNYYYSAGVFNGDGQNFKNVDDHVDFMGRAWVAPFSFTGEGPLHDVELGGSFWTGDRSNTLPFTSQTTQGGFTYLSNSAFSFTPMGAAAESIQLRQVGRLKAFAGELNAPIDHKYGLRGELVWKDSPLSADNIASTGTGTIIGGADLKGYSFYGEAWYWLLGDDRIIGDQQGLEPFSRYRKFGVKPVQDGLMLTVRYEHLDEDLTADADVANLGNVLGMTNGTKTKLDSYELGLNYWHSKRFRVTGNYVINHFGGDTALVRGLANKNEQEFLFRFAIAL